MSILVIFKRLVRFLILAALGLLVSISRADPVLEETIEKSYPMEPTAKLSIRNDDGSIRIYGADIKEMKLQAIKKAYSTERLNQITVDVSLKPGEISIATQYPPKPKWGLWDRSGAVDYVIVLPWTCDISRCDLVNGELQVEGMRGKEARASLANGRLFGHNCFTDLHVSVTNGGLDVGYDWWEEHKFSLDAEIVNGNARAFIPADAIFHLLASSLDGHVFSDFTDKEHRQSGGVAKIDMLVGGAGETEIKVRAVNGSIKITETNL
jgi:hypothetical protein